MDTQDNENNVTNVPDLDSTQIPPVSRPLPVLKSPLNAVSIKQFFQVTGGSTLYCISAVLIAYGIVQLLKPVLTASESLTDAMPCLLTLHGYELALLGVLLFIVFKKVVDDAVSLTVLISLFLIGTSIMLGSVADRGIQAAMFWGIAGIVIGFIKLVVLRRFAKIPFSVVMIVAISGIVAYNYLGPAFMARSVSMNSTDEPARRSLWLFLYLLMLIGALTIWLDALRRKLPQENKGPFLQSPVMAYLFGLLVLFGSGVHQYTMAYAFTLERVLLDYIPVTAVGCLLLIEVLRLSRKSHIVLDAAIACVPGVLTLCAIYDQSVLSSGQWGPGLLSYPPVMLGGIGITFGVVAFLRKSYLMWAVVFAYGLGVILTIGFSPEYPYRLNLLSGWITLAVSLFVYGLIARNSFTCFGALVVLCIGLPSVNEFPELMKNWQLTVPGSLAGVCGLGTIGLYLIFGKKLDPTLRTVGAIFLAVFIFDYLPATVHVRYLIVLVVLSVLFTALWFRTKDILFMSILAIPVFIRGYILAKVLANWRYIILGFVALLTGAWVSVFKRSLNNKANLAEQDKLQPESSP